MNYLHPVGPESPVVQTYREMLAPAAGRLVTAVEKSPRQDTGISGTISESGTVGLTGHSFTKYSKVMDNGMFTYFVVSD